MQRVMTEYLKIKKHNLKHISIPRKLCALNRDRKSNSDFAPNYSLITKVIYSIKFNLILASPCA